MSGLAPAFEWVPLDAVRDLHERSLERFGGHSGLRNAGGLESAVARPQQILAYEPNAGLA